MTLCPWNADYTIGRGSNANYDFRLATGNINLAFQTTDEAGTARTVTPNGRITTENHADTTITVKGTGTNATLAEGCPKWVKGVSIVDGDIVIDVKSRGTYIYVK